MGNYSAPAAPAAVGALAAGEAILPRNLVTSNNVLTNVSGYLRLTFFRAQRTELVNQLRVISGTTPAAATPTLCRMGVWSVNETTGVCSLVAGTPNDTTLFAAANTRYTKALAAAMNKIQGVLYAFGLLVVSAATMPTFQGVVLSLNTGEAALADRLAGYLPGQTDLPASFNVSAITDSVQLFYAVLLP